VEQGKLDLDGAIKDYWPGYIEYFDNMKKWLEDNQPDLTALMSEYNYKKYDITLRRHLTQTCEGVPGEYFHYSGFLYSPLSRVVDHVSEKNFEQLIREDIIQKLNMTHSLPMQTNTTKPEVLEKLAKPYSKNEEPACSLNLWVRAGSKVRLLPRNSWICLSRLIGIIYSKRKEGPTRSGENPQDQRRPPLRPDSLPEAQRPLMKAVLQR